MPVKMTDKVRHDNQITTIDELDQQGLIEFKEYDNFYSSRTVSGQVKKIFC